MVSACAAHIKYSRQDSLVLQDRYGGIQMNMHLYENESKRQEIQGRKAKTEDTRTAWETEQIRKLKDERHRAESRSPKTENDI